MFVSKCHSRKAFMNQSIRIAFIDPAVSDLASLLGGIRPDIETVLLASSEAATKQIARTLKGRQGIEAIHIVAHGQPGALSFSSGLLSLETVDGCRADLAAIGEALEVDGGLMLWSCNTGYGKRGAAFVEALSRATGAAVAASPELIGAAAHGGTWTLDAPGGGTALPPMTPQGVGNYAGILTTFTTTTGTDNPALSTGNDTVIVTASNQVDATDTLNGLAGTDVIQIGTAAAGTSIDLSAAASDGVKGFVSFEGITFVNTSGTSTATFDAAQFGTGKIANTVAIQSWPRSSGPRLRVVRGRAARSKSATSPRRAQSRRIPGRNRGLRPAPCR
jgi:hypothetical protein